jgi:putative tryptophan/tyrosine transport system substrate-binding protein
MTRIVWIAILIVAALAAPLTAEAQPAGKVYRIGWLHPVTMPPTWMEAMRQSLRDHGYVEGRNLVVDYQLGDGRFERLPAMAAELVRLNPDILMSGNSAAVRALIEATGSIPIVMLGTGDPVALGFVASLGRPGGNVTGMSGMYPQLSGKQLELLKEIVPRLTRVASLSNPGNPQGAIALQEARGAAQVLGFRLHNVEVRDPAELDTALARLLKDRPAALLLPPDTMIHTSRARIAEFALKHNLPSVSVWREYAEAGGLLVYGVSIPDLFRRSVSYIDRILKGANPGDLPIEQPTKLDVIVNLKTAKALGLTIPPAVLARADEVIQ